MIINREGFFVFPMIAFLLLPESLAHMKVVEWFPSRCAAHRAPVSSRCVVCVCNRRGGVQTHPLPRRSNMSYSSVPEGNVEVTHRSPPGALRECAAGFCRLPSSWHGAVLSHQTQGGLRGCGLRCRGSTVPGVLLT